MILWAAAGLLIAGLAGYLLMVVLIWGRIFLPSLSLAGKRPFRFTPAEFQAAYEELELVTADGLSFGAWFFCQPGTSQVVVVIPGHRHSREHFLGIAIALWRKGFNVFLYSHRGTLGAERAVLTLGINEIEELITSLEYLQERIKNPQIGLLGYSLGAAVALLVAAHRPGLGAAVLDSPFGDARRFLDQNIRQIFHLPGTPFRLAIELWLRLRYRVWLNHSSPCQVLPQVEPLPLFFIHGAADQLTPVAQIRDLYESYRGPREIWLVPEAEHCTAYWVDRSLYVERVAGFFARQLGLKPGQLRLVTDDES